ncbi:hypothetical protein HMPREF1597_02638 [Escherichia coli 907701]|nr:hypothetical protein HMPREF1597_02638 [Escherichia coli 907701]ESE02910.1 hypothetical protein HMPREF1614_01116 [Escherichia coli 908624]
MNLLGTILLNPRAFIIYHSFQNKLFYIRYLFAHQTIITLCDSHQVSLLRKPVQQNL